MVLFPYQYWKTGIDLWQLSINAQSVISMRMLGAMGMWYASPNENRMMVIEKQKAASKSLQNATTATLSGKPPSAVFSAALSPYSNRAKANVRRLKSGNKR